MPLKARTPESGSSIRALSSSVRMRGIDTPFLSCRRDTPQNRFFFLFPPLFFPLLFRDLTLLFPHQKKIGRFSASRARIKLPFFRDVGFYALPSLLNPFLWEGGAVTDGRIIFSPGEEIRRFFSEVMKPPVLPFPSLMLAGGGGAVQSAGNPLLPPDTKRTKQTLFFSLL